MQHHQLPTRALFGRHGPDELRASLELDDEREPVRLQHCLDRLEVILRDAIEDHIAVVRGMLEHKRQHQLRHELIGAGVIEYADVREVEEYHGAVGEPVDLPLDHHPHHSAGAARHEIGIPAWNPGLQRRQYVDVGLHASPARSGITICNCAPVNGLKPSTRGSPVSHDGSFVILAVPLRMLSEPS